MYARRDFCGRASASARPDGPAIAAAPTPSLAGWAVRVVGAGSAVLNLHGSPLPHLHRGWAHPCQVCTGTGLSPPKSTATGLAAGCHICTRTGLGPPATAPGLGSPRPHLRRDWAVGAARWRRCGGTARCGRTRASGCSSTCTAAIRPRTRRAIVILPRRSRLPLLPAARHHRRV